MRQTKRRHPTKTDAPAAPQAADDDPVPENIDEFRNELARRISRYIGDRKEYWRGCKEPLCRRRRACLAPRIRCSNAPPLPPAAPEDWGRTSALIQRAVKKRQAQIAAGE